MSDILPGEDANSPALVAWRLGRVEKAVDENHKQVLGKLDEVLSLYSDVKQNKFRIGQVEDKIKSIYRFLAALSIVLVGTVADLIARHLFPS